MSNARKLLSLAAAALLVGAAACSGNKERTESATALLDQARALVETHNYDSAMSVLDTLDIKYRDCLDQRRAGTTLRLTALSALTRDSLVSAEAQYSLNKAELDSLSPLFEKKELAGTDGYFVDKSAFTGKEMNATGIQARVDDEGYLFIVVNLYGKRIGLNALSFDGVTTPAAESIAVEGSEIMSLSQEKTADLLDRLAQASAPAKLTLVGSKGSATATLSAKQLESIALTRRYANALQTDRRLSISLEKLERQLAKLSDNLANQMQ